MPKLIDLTGQGFGRLTVLRRAKHEFKWGVCWVCACSCGNPDVVVVRGNYLKQGRTKSCGCLFKEYQKKGGRKGSKAAPKMTQEKADLIRSMYADEQPVTMGELAKINEVGTQTIFNIIHGKTWTGLPRAKKRGKLGILDGYEDILGLVKGGL